MKKSLLFISSVVLSVAMIGCTTTETEATMSSTTTTEAVNMQSISGSVAYRQRIALPDHAVVSVTLEDISLADKAADVIATDSFVTGGKQVPFSFKLDYDANKILPKHTYNVRAKITVDGKLRFITDTITPVITDQAETQTVHLMMIGVK